jgi:glutamate/tyrosine decarboxylase-like PLP-dependent enzyme
MTPLLVAELNKKHGWGLTIHIDGASGAFVAPFLYPDLKWDFRLPNVSSINASGGMGRDEGEALLLRPAWQRRRASCCCALSSPAGLSQPCHHHHPTRTRTLITTATFQYTPGHKYGLVYPGLGWIVWRDASHLPESMVFYENYLGTLERSITLNFSKPATNIVAQYYQFLRLGYSGYRKIMTNLDIIRKRLTNSIERTGHFEILSKDVGVPVVAFRLKKVEGSDGKQHHRLYDEFALADRLRMRGWVLPAYTMPDNANDVKLMRVTIREDFSISMADMLVKDIEDALEYLDNHFTFNKGQMDTMVQFAMGRRLSRLDSSILAAAVDGTKQSVRPC